MIRDGIVHVVNGDITAGLLEEADVPGEIRVWADALDGGGVEIIHQALEDLGHDPPEGRLTQADRVRVPGGQAQGHAGSSTGVAGAASAT